MSKESGIAVKVVPTKPFDGQKPGTSGLRKKVLLANLFRHQNYKTQKKLYRLS
jgi:phosphoglucomutase